MRKSRTERQNYYELVVEKYQKSRERGTDTVEMKQRRSSLARLLLLGVVGLFFVAAGRDLPTVAASVQASGEFDDVPAAVSDAAASTAGTADESASAAASANPARSVLVQFCTS